MVPPSVAVGPHITHEYKFMIASSRLATYTKPGYVSCQCHSFHAVGFNLEFEDCNLSILGVCESFDQADRLSFYCNMFYYSMRAVEYEDRQRRRYGGDCQVRIRIRIHQRPPTELISPDRAGSSPLNA